MPAGFDLLYKKDSVVLISSSGNHSIFFANNYGIYLYHLFKARTILLPPKRTLTNQNKMNNLPPKRYTFVPVAHSNGGRALGQKAKVSDPPNRMEAKPVTLGRHHPGVTTTLGRVSKLPTQTVPVKSGKPWTQYSKLAKVLNTVLCTDAISNYAIWVHVDKPVHLDSFNTRRMSLVMPIREVWFHRGKSQCKYKYKYYVVIEEIPRPTLQLFFNISCGFIRKNDAVFVLKEMLQAMKQLYAIGIKFSPQPEDIFFIGPTIVIGMKNYLISRRAYSH